MAIQILGLREYFSHKHNKVMKKDAFFEKGWRAPSVAALLKDPMLYLAQVPEAERVNLYYTVADCFEEPGRILESQKVIPFDIDDIEAGSEEDVARAAVEALGVDWNKTGVVFSGNGVQLLIEIEEAFTAVDVFEKERELYRACCVKINLALESRNLRGKADPVVWSPARIMRMPCTKNVKPNKPERMARLIQGNVETQDFTIKKCSGIIDIAKADSISPAVMSKFPDPDRAAVLGECEFLKWVQAEPAAPDEPHLYAALSVIGRLPEAKEIATAIFQPRFGKRNHGGTREDLLLKLEQATTASGPRTCKNINTLWGKCASCKYNGKVVSPILLKGPDFIETEKTGFHKTTTDSNGNPRPGKPVVEDLRRFFHRDTPYITMADSKIVFTWKGTHWTEIEEAELEGFAYQHFNPKPNSNTRREFVKVVQCTNLRTPEWFSQSTDRRMNFMNGVLNIDTGEFENHDQGYGFRYVLPYCYDPDSRAPVFEKFLDDVTLGREELKSVLLEFAGYAFSNDECWEHKALMLLGHGRNGKSTFMSVLEALAGQGTYSSITLSDMKDEAMRYQLDGKLFNMAEETSPSALADSSIFKNIVAGGEIVVKKLWKQPYTIHNRAKIIVACNELPTSQDKTDALYQRMLVVPFDAKFVGEKADKDMKLKLRRELPGVFNLVLEGYRRLKKARHFTTGQALEAQIDKFKEDNDSVRMFMAERLCISPDVRFPGSACKDIYGDYMNYCESTLGEKYLISGKFFERLKHLIPDYDQRFVRETVNGVRERRLRGIKLPDGGSF